MDLLLTKVLALHDLIWPYVINNYLKGTKPRA